MYIIKCNLMLQDDFILGKVVDIEDPNKIGRVRCEVYGRSEGIPKDYLPWYTPLCWNKDTFDLPKVGEVVYVRLWKNDIHQGQWMLREHDDRFEMSDDDYKSGKILLRRYLEDWEDQGLLTIHYSKTDGLMIQLSETKVNLRRDGTIHLFSESLGKQIDITHGQISLGSVDVSDEPAVMGLQNNDCHEMQVDYTQWLCDTLYEGFMELSSVASQNPFTSPLAPVWSKLAGKIKGGSTPKTNEIKNFLPELLSNLVSLDKDP